MTKLIVDKETLVAIADSVRRKTGKFAPIVVSDLATEVDSIPSGGGVNEFKAPFYIDSIIGGSQMAMLTRENPFSPENISKDWSYSAIMQIDRTLTSTTTSYFGFMFSTDGNTDYRMSFTAERKDSTGGCNLKFLYRMSKMGSASGSGMTTITMFNDDTLATVLDENNELRFSVDKVGNELRISISTLVQSDVVVPALVIPIKDMVGNNSQYLCFGGARVPSASNPYQMSVRTSLRDIRFYYKA